MKIKMIRSSGNEFKDLGISAEEAEYLYLAKAGKDKTFRFRR